MALEAALDLDLALDLELALALTLLVTFSLAFERDRLQWHACGNIIGPSAVGIVSLQIENLAR